MKRLIPWLVAILLLGCLALGFLVFRQKAEITRIDFARGAAEKDAQKQILGLQRQVAADRTAHAASERQIAQLTAAAPGDPSNRGSANGGRKVIHVSDILRDHPEYLPFYLKQMRRNVDRMYGDGLSTLNLPPDQLSQLKNLLAERQMSNADAQQAAEAAGLERGTPAWQDAMKQATQDTQQQIAGILGPNAESMLAQLQTRAMMQSMVQYNYAPDFADAGIALSPAQSSGLAQAMADANYTGKDTSTRPANYNVTDPDTGLTPHDDRIIANAAPVLSPAQLQMLKTDQIESGKISAVIRQYNSGGGPVTFAP